MVVCQGSILAMRVSSYTMYCKSSSYITVQVIIPVEVAFTSISKKRLTKKIVQPLRNVVLSQMILRTKTAGRRLATANQ